MNVVKKIFAPSEVKVCFSILNDLDSQFSNSMFLVIKKEVEAQLMDFDKTRYSIIQDGMVPKHLVLMLISNSLGGHISSGSYHTYRGVLGLQGHELLKMWNQTISIMMSEGYYSQEEGNEDQEWIKNQIKAVG